LTDGAVVGGGEGALVPSGGSAPCPDAGSAVASERLKIHHTADDTKPMEWRFVR